MKPDAQSRLPLYLTVHAGLGALIGAATAVLLVATDAIGMATVSRGTPAAFILVPALAGLFALCAAASALDLLRAPGEGGRHAPGRAADGRAVAVRVPPRG